MVLGVSFGVRSRFCTPQEANVLGLTLKERGIVIFTIHGSWRISRSHRFRFCTAPKANVLGLTLKERGIVIFAWFLAYLSESGLVFAPRKKRMFWGHTLKERGIVIFAWFQCFVWAFSYLYWVRVMPTIFTLRC